MRTLRQLDFWDVGAFAGILALLLVVLALFAPAARSASYDPSFDGGNGGYPLCSWSRLGWQALINGQMKTCTYTVYGYTWV